MIPFLTGAYGHPVVKTPHLNRLAEEGVRFDAAYTPCPICVPARASLMTGKYVSHIGAYDNAASFSCEEPTPTSTRPTSPGCRRDLCVSYHHPHEPFWPPRDQYLPGTSLADIPR